MAGVRKLTSGTMQGWFKHYEGHRAFFTLGRRATRREVLNAVHTLEVEHAQIRQGVAADEQAAAGDPIDLAEPVAGRRRVLAQPAGQEQPGQRPRQPREAPGGRLPGPALVVQANLLNNEAEAVGNGPMSGFVIGRTAARRDRHAVTLRADRR